MVKVVVDQSALTTSPILILEPNFMVKGQPGKFTISLCNKGLSDVSDIQLYEDYYVLVESKDGVRSYILAGGLTILPDKTWELLGARDSIKVDLDFTKQLDGMNKIYGETKGYKMRLARFTVHFNRKIDGRQFTVRKAFIIAGHGDLLIDSERQMPAPFGPSWSDVKRDLGVEIIARYRISNTRILPPDRLAQTFRSAI